MTDRTLREKINDLMEVYDHNGGTAFVVKEHVLAILDAHPAPPAIADAPVSDRPAPDAVAEADHDCPLYGPPSDCIRKQCHLCQRSKP